MCCVGNFAHRGISKSAVSERFVYGTERKLSELMRRDLCGLALALVVRGTRSVSASENGWKRSSARSRP